MDADLLLRQASETAHTYFHQAIRSIDDRFGKGYAEKHPELIAGFMQTAALDFMASFVGSAVEEGLRGLTDSLGDLEIGHRNE
jgi:hypothetical protein